ncbi:hypothetical protein CLV91_1812 [Maribacter vaceletii]|uniref:Outer membrane protein with beta-barrel domain n=1 Tax=Maribacter vaceletii TaxID=1206816 RepID=A0A495E849_9FLAO|nr:hypothetical protein [Maribacter vaceletii]RKR13098.1 hypothetical protein CLV91_1812 [Maribacter vaceletii]
MRNGIIIALLIYFCICTMQAQSDTDNSATFLDKTEFKVGYSGNLFWNNGLSVGAEYLWKQNTKIKEKRKGPKKITHQYLLDGNLGFTTNFATKTDTGIYTNYGLIWRRTNAKGKQISIALNPLGYYRSILPETYEVKGEQVDKVSFPGRSYYAPSLSIGLGKLRKGKKLTGRYFNVNLMFRTPYNAGTLPSISLQYGYRFNFKKKK